MERVSLQPGYILHHYPWRDSSQLVEVFTQHHGRIGLIARGARRPKSKLRGVLQPFKPLLVSWQSRGELGTLVDAEAAQAGAQQVLTGSRLLCGFYINELLLRLLHRYDPHPQLFGQYIECLSALSERESKPQHALRIFEKRLLDSCGYGLVLNCDIDTGETIRAEQQYHYVPEQGPCASAVHQGGLLVSGRTLLALESEALADADLVPARQLLRAAIDIYLGGKPLRTRKVLYDMRRD